MDSHQMKWLKTSQSTSMTTLMISKKEVTQKKADDSIPSTVFRLDDSLQLSELSLVMLLCQLHCCSSMCVEVGCCHGSIWFCWVSFLHVASFSLLCHFVMVSY